MTAVNPPNHPTLTIIQIWTSNKVSIAAEYRPGIDKFRLAIVPAENGGPAVDYYLDRPLARVLFRSLTTGQLTGPATTQNKKADQGVEAYQGYTKSGDTTRQVFIQNKPDGVGITISKDNGEKAKNAVFPSAFQVQIIAQAVDAFLTRLDLRTDPS